MNAMVGNFTFDYLAFRSAKVRSKTSLKSKGEVISLRLSQTSTSLGAKI